MKRILFILFGAFLTLQASAQPAMRRSSKQNKGNAANGVSRSGSDRASLQFPTAASMPEDVVWRRDVYRQLDLKKDANAPLYYPVEPSGGRMNLFTYLFHLVLDGKINAYDYRLDGKESFASADKAKVKELLDRYSIYYQEKDGKLTVDNSDIPSAEVTRFYIKESAYYDQRTATYHRKVVAICPVLIRTDDFGGEGTPYPLFWLKYDDISGFLTKAPLMNSNLNNASNMTADDYFTLNKYDGDIYMTNNLQGKVLPNDSTRAKEQKIIEKQLVDFEKHIWVSSIDAKKDSLDSIAKLQPIAKKEKVRRSSPTRARSRRTTVKEAKPAKAESSSSSSSAPRVSVRRQRH
jgi:gliding motility associated protien GldN